ncbi:tail fiber protein [Desulfosporosinus youngiae]|uniref:Phage tail fiber repeat protein n=1 Tax=Desulfosporosinus youngiae DSM 17734 TaxID=768710 RepID=H5XZT0_9FIRM|nr:tail fiber protein [Desulfosporosinus youngiae]EHQ92126.1 Phage tail fiber repeat protein [Desulfosporosinus youngiae DSM 17734]
MARKVLIQIRRGLEGSIGTLAVGELGFCTDTKKLYIGTESGNELLVAAQTVGDMLKSIYDTDNDGKVDVAEVAESVPWTGVSGKPSTFTPVGHTHNASDINAGTVAIARLPAASTSAAGISQLNNTMTSTSTTQAATANAVKTAYDLAAGKLSPGVTWNQLKGV